MGEAAHAGFLCQEFLRGGGVNRALFRAGATVPRMKIKPGKQAEGKPFLATLF
jgi:hypothetical protein